MDLPYSEWLLVSIPLPDGIPFLYVLTYGYHAVAHVGAPYVPAARTEWWEDIWRFLFSDSAVRDHAESPSPRKSPQILYEIAGW